MIGDCVQIKVEAGIISEKDELLLMPQNILVGIRGIEVQGMRCEQAGAGTICELGIRLPNDFDVNYLKKGTVLCDPKFPTPFVRKFIVKVVIYDLPQGAISKGEQIMIHSYTSKSAGKILNLISTVDSRTGTVIKERPKFLKAGQFANICIKLDERLCLELFSNYRMLGRVAIRSGSHTIAAG